MADLLPCPFCGYEAAHATCTLTRDKDADGNKGTFTGHFVNCIRCGADNQGIAEGFRSPEEAAEHWNRRATVSETRAPDNTKLMVETAFAAALKMAAEVCDEIAMTWARRRRGGG